MKFKSDIEVQAGLKDSSGSLGASGQILSSTSGNVSWVTPTVNTVARDVQNQVKAGVAITKGQAVYVTGADGTNIIVGLASNTSEATSSKTLGLLNATVAINGMADVVQIGRLSGLNTIGATAGDPVWLGTNGNLIYGLINKPYAPAHLVFIGIVTRVNDNNGEIFVSVQNGFELNEIHDVDLKTNVPINGDILGYDGTLWVNKTIAQWLGYTPANASGTTNYVSKFTGATSLGNSQIFDNGTNVGIGTTSPANKLDVNGNINVPSTNFFRYDGDTGLIGSATTIGGSSNQLGIRASNDILFATNGANERMRITSSGNVGIGTTSPLQKLHVEGLSYFGSDIFTLNNGGIFFSGNNSYQRGIYSNTSGLTLQTLGSPKVTITDGGNVGIGTTAPSAKLESYKGAQSDTITRANASAYFWGADIGLAIGQSQSTPFGTWIQSLKHDNNATFPLSLNPNGSNVGVGTVNPQRKLEVKGSHTTATFRVYYPDENVAGQDASVDIWASEPGISFNGSGIGSNVNGQPYYGRTNPALGQGFIRFIDGTTAFHNSSTDAVYAERMRITPGGSVGIGTSSPISKLNVNTTDSANNVITVTNGTQELALGVNNGSGGSFLFENSNNALRLGTAGTERMRITNEGNVAIGTTNPGFATAGRTVLTLNGSSNSLMEFQAGGAFKSYFYQSGTFFEIYDTSLLQFAVNGSERMRIANNGNIGIGTTNTIHQLSVASKIGGATFGDSFIEFPSSGNTIVKANNDVILGYLQSTSIKQSGNIGVGIVNPSASAILHLKSNSQGFLPPVMSQSERDSIGAPEQGLMIFNTDTETVDVFTNGGGWKSLLFLI